MDTTARNITAYINMTFSFGLELKIEKVEGNSIEITVTSLRTCLSFSEEEKMRFKR